ncbi:MAG: hypothetical protein LKF88_05655 [Microbacteriaceae bacterium]|nr:hypothetical protein [Microbacteriaceae bacterium]MCI1207146.1 hypothetical protein [Microbacteriaceae bacterium]
MRLWSLITLTVASVIAILTGIGLATVWHPDTTVQESVSFSRVQGENVAVIPSKTLTALRGEPRISVEGDRGGYIAAGPSRDVRAWVGESAVAQVRWSAKQPTGARLSAAASDGRSGTPSPVGSDLWTQSSSGTQRATLAVTDPAHTSVIISSKTGAALPRAAVISWRGQPGSPLALPLIAGGSAGLIAALVLAFLIYRTERPGPRRHSHRGARGRSRGRRMRGLAEAVAVVSVAGLVLTGCSAEPGGASASASATASAANHGRQVVTESHFLSILQQVSLVSKQVTAGNTTNLESRFAGPALAQWRENVAIRAKYAQQPALTAFPTGTPEVFLPQASARFPRTVFVAYPSKDTGAPETVVLQQTSPRTNYQVISMTSVVPKASFPSLPSASTGMTVLENATGSLQIRPNQLVTRYAAALQGDDGAPAAEAFQLSDDIFATMTREDENKSRNQLGSNGILEIQRTQADAAPVAMSTQSSGAIVAVAMNETWTWKPAEQNGTINVTDDLSKAMLGKDSSTTGIQQVYSTMLLFHVPVSGGGKVTLLGYQQAPISIKEL